MHLLQHIVYFVFTSIVYPVYTNFWPDAAGNQYFDPINIKYISQWKKKTAIKWFENNYFG